MRSKEKEILDLGPQHYSLDEYEDALIKLNKIGRWLGGDRANLQALEKMSPPPSTILDVGCGGGFFARRMASQFPDACVVGLEINPLAIAFAKRQASPSNVIYKESRQSVLEETPKSYDVVMTTLVCHHMDDDMIIDFLQRACRVAKRKVIINDLHRHTLAYYLFKGIAPVFFRNRLVMHDGPLSVQRAFKKEDWQRYLKAAGISTSAYTIAWKCFFRWLVEIDCT